jgi:hypothetical protein
MFPGRPRVFCSLPPHLLPCQRTEAGRLSLLHLSLRESYGLLRVSPSTTYTSLYNATLSLRTTRSGPLLSSTSSSMLAQLYTAALCLLAGSAAYAAPGVEVETGKIVSIPNTHPLIYYHGRWDAAPATWWCVMIDIYIQTHSPIRPGLHLVSRSTSQT